MDPSLLPSITTQTGAQEERAAATVLASNGPLLKLGMMTTCVAETSGWRP